MTLKKLLLFFVGILLTGLSFSNTEKYRVMFNSNPSTEATIGWNQLSGSNPIVYFGTTDHGTDWNSYSQNQTPYRQVSYLGMDNRFAILQNLLPNTVYYFVIKDDNGVSDRYWFTTCPDVNTETLSFISGGDSRSGRTQRQKGNEMVAKIRPHAVLFGGDLVNTPGNTSVQEWLDDWQLTITSDGQMIPLVHSFGNHEDYGSGGPNFIHDLFDTNYDVYYNLKFGGDLFSMYTLNGEVYPNHTISNNSVRTAQTNWLNNSLSSDASIWKAAQYHRPIVPHYSGKGEGSDEYTDWANLFYDYGVRLVMESDAHVVKMTEEVKPVYTGTPSGNSSNWFSTENIDTDKGITFIGEGSWGTIRTPDDIHPMTTATGSFYSFNWILVDACKIEIRTIDTQNPNGVPAHSFGDYTSISTGLDNQIWKPTALPTGVRKIIKCNPPVADFSASETEVFTGTTIDFTDESTNGPISWEWNFGDGSPLSTSQNPSHTFNTPGNYTISLSATNLEGTGTETKTNYIVVVDPTAPTTNFSANITNALVSEQIQFTDLSTGVPSNWSWDFGDGLGTSTDENPSYAYGAPGNYTVTLTTSNAYGNDMETKDAYITITDGGSILIEVATGNDDAEEFRDDNSMYLTSSDLEIGNDFGTEQYTGIRFQQVNIPHGAVITNAKLRFRADESDGSSSQLNIYIKAEDADHSEQFTSVDGNISSRTLTDAQFTWADGSVPAWSTDNIYDTPDLTAIVQEVIDRTGWNSGNAMSFILWSDLGESSERVADSYEGGYPAQLIVDFTIPVMDAPVAQFNADLTSVCSGSTISFSDLSTNDPAAWNWQITGPVNFESTNQNPSFNFVEPGLYSVSLEAINLGGGNTISQTNYITVHALPEVQLNTFDPICENEAAIGLTQGTPANGIYSGIGVNNNEFDPEIAGPGSHDINYSFTDANNCSNNATNPIVVFAKPDVQFASLDTVCTKDEIIVLTQGSPAGGTYSGLGVTGNEFDPATAGEGVHSITYSFADENSCSESANQNIVVEICLAISESSKPEISIYPNPTNSEFTISGIITNNPVHIEIFNNSGQLVYDKIVNEDPIQVSVSNWERGNYTIQLTNNNKTTTYQIVVQ